MTAASVLERVRDRARNLSSVFPYQRQGEALYLDPEDWKVLADELDHVLLPRPIFNGGNAMEILQSVNHAASAREVPAQMASHELPAEANEIMRYADDRETGSHERGGAADCSRSHDHQTARSSGQAARPSAVRGDADGDLADAVRSQQLEELEARQNELHLAMHEVESMPASEAQTACIIRLAARMRRLVELRGKSEVGRSLDA